MTNPQTKTLLVDKNRNIVPQYFDALAGVFKPVAFDDVSHVSVNQTQLLRANNGEILYQFLRPDGLWESYNPATTGGGGGGPLPTGLVRSVNFNLPDANGDVAVPLMFNLIPMFTPDTLPYEFPEGDSVLSFEFDPANNPDWDELLNGEVSAGELIVKTMHYPDADLVIQEIDTNRDGRYFASYSRSNIGNTWRPIVHNVEVKTVNGIGPDALGNVEISTLGTIGKPEVTYHYYIPPQSSDWTYEFDINIQDYDEQTDVLEFYRGTQRMDKSNAEIVAYNNPTMSIRLINGWSISEGYPMEIWRYKFGNSGGSPSPTAPTITTYKFYEEVPASTTDHSVHVPGIKEGNFTYFIGLNDGILRGAYYEIEVDEVNELLTLKYTTTSMSRFTIIVNVFS